MTEEQLQPQQLELLKRYDAELQQLEILPPAVIELEVKGALALITHMQIAAANPAVKHNPLLPSAIAAAKQIQKSFNPDSVIHEVLELGWQEPKVSGEDIPHQIFTSVSQRQKKLRPPPYRPDDHDHF
jgi:hypothetical protein